MTKENRLKQDADQPPVETCFEYKLVGIVMHSGAASSGHYWSYINTKRGEEEPAASDP